MKTITIEDPADGVAAMKIEMPEVYLPSIWFSDTHQFIASGWTRNQKGDLKSSFQGCGATVADAIAALRERIDAANPLAELQSEAAAIGMKLVPA